MATNRQGQVSTRSAALSQKAWRGSMLVAVLTVCFSSWALRPTAHAQSESGHPFSTIVRSTHQVASHHAVAATAVLSHTVYAGTDDGAVFALDATTGSKLWTYRTHGPITSRLVVIGTTIYVTSGDGTIYALDFRDGSMLWSYQTNSPITSSPVIAGSTLYFGSTSGTLYALDMHNGRLIWSYPAGGPIDASPAVANNTVFVPSARGTIDALDVPTGDLLWRFTADEAVETTPTVVDNRVYAGSDGGSVYALNARNGQRLWSFSTGGRIRSSPVEANGIIYMGSDDDNVYAINAQSGAQIWSYPTGGAIDDAAAVARGIVYVGSMDGVVYALNAHTGARVWSVKTTSKVQSTPVIAADVVYIGSVDNTVYAFSARNGDQLWSFGTGSAVQSSPAVGEQATPLTERIVTPADAVYPGDGSAQFFAQTGHNMAAPFLTFWEHYGGLQTFGYPLTDALTEDGHLVQYTERFRLELINGSVVTGPLGHILTLQNNVPPLAPFPATATRVYFSSTGHSLSGRFLQYWQSHSGALLLGPPISEVTTVPGTDASRTPITVQWFERGRLDYGPPQKASGGIAGVHFGALGTAMLAQRGWLD